MKRGPGVKATRAARGAALAVRIPSRGRLLQRRVRSVSYRVPMTGRSRVSDAEEDIWTQVDPPTLRWRRGQRGQKVAAWIAVAVVVLSVAASLASSRSYGTPLWWSEPSHLH